MEIKKNKPALAIILIALVLLIAGTAYYFTDGFTFGNVPYSIYVDKKEEIIQSVLEAKTRQQVNNNLMKFFRSEEVKVIFQRLYPLIKNMPAK